MMQALRQQQWQHILQMTQQLQLLSSEENWLGMSELSVQRQEKLDEFFSVELANTDAEEIADGIQKIMQSDALLIEDGIEQQKVLSKGVKKLATGKQVVKAYGDVEKSQ